MSQIDKLIPLLNYVYQTKELLQNPSLKKCVRKKDLTQILKELNAFDELCQQYMYGVRSRTEGHAEVTAAVVGDFSSGKSSFKSEVPSPSVSTQPVLSTEEFP